MLILHKILVTAQVHRHLSSADRTAGNKLCGNQAVFPRQIHPVKQSGSVIDLIVTAPCALELPVISLGSKNIFIRKPCFPELVIHIGRQNKMRLLLHKLKNRLIKGHGRRLYPVQPGML